MVNDFVDEWQKLFLKKMKLNFTRCSRHIVQVFIASYFSILSFLGSGRETNNLDDKWSSSFVGHCSNRTINLARRLETLD